jgi:hypothetical protein
VEFFDEFGDISTDDRMPLGHGQWHDGLEIGVDAE